MNPVLYSFRRCPYAMRARMALTYAGITVEHREIELKNKPPAMLAISPKGTVPVLVLDDGAVLDESLSIMSWALSINDPDGWLKGSAPSSLIDENDGSFKRSLDRYKYAERYPEHTAEYYREQGEIFLAKLELILVRNSHLSGDKPTMTDYAIFPFIRQFVLVDRGWFDSANYPNLRLWLDRFLVSDLFATIMVKHSVWSE